MITVGVDTACFDAGREIATLGRGAGAVVSFVGIVRDDAGMTAMTLEHYPGMTERVLADIANAATERWHLGGVVIRHRVGFLAVGAPIVFVGTASAHRADALDACTFLIDRLKTDVPFWKREHLADGRTRWVETKSSDAAAAARWTSGEPVEADRL